MSSSFGNPSNPGGPSNRDELIRLLGSLQNQTDLFKRDLNTQQRQLSELQADVEQIISLGDQRIARNAERIAYQYQAQLERMQRSDADEKKETNAIRYQALADVEELKTELQAAQSQIRGLELLISTPRPPELFTYQGNQNTGSNLGQAGSLSMLSLLPPPPPSYLQQQPPTSLSQPPRSSSRGRSARGRGNSSGVVRSTRGRKKTASIASTSTSLSLPSVLTTLI